MLCLTQFGTNKALLPCITYHDYKNQRQQKCRPWEVLRDFDSRTSFLVCSRCRLDSGMSCFHLLRAVFSERVSKKREKERGGGLNFGEGGGVSCTTNLMLFRPGAQWPTKRLSACIPHTPPPSTEPIEQLPDPTSLFHSLRAIFLSPLRWVTGDLMLSGQIYTSVVEVLTYY